MPMIDFKKVKEEVGILRVLTLLGRDHPRQMGRQSCGRCPFGLSRAATCCKYNVEENKWYCHCCERGGDQVRLFAEVKSWTMFTAACELCRLVGIPVPYLMPPAHQMPGAAHWTEGRDE